MLLTLIVGRRMWFKLENQFECRIVSELSGIFSSGFKDSKRIYGNDSGDGLFIHDIEDKYIISDKFGDDLQLITNVSQFGSSGIFIPTNTRPIDKKTLYQNGNRYIALNRRQLLVGFFDEMIFFSNELRENDPVYEEWRYDVNGDIIATPSRRAVGANLHNNVNLITNAPNSVFFLSKDETPPNVIESQATAAFNNKNYELSISDAGNWSGWWKSKAGGVAGTYQPFGSSSGSKSVGYVQYTDSENKTYVSEFDITESNSVWSVTYDLNGEVYTSDTEPAISSAIFTNQDALPVSITLNFDSFVSHDNSINSFTSGQLIL